MTEREKRIHKLYKYLTKRLNFKNHSSSEMPAQKSLFDYNTHRSLRKLR
jgi:hypothetical protein